MTIASPLKTRGAIAVTALGILALTGCAQTTPAVPGEAAATPGAASAPASETVTLTYDGGLVVLDAATLEVVGDVPIEGFTRVNPVGDGQNVLVTTETGFQVLDTQQPALTGLTFEGSKAGHAVPHAGKTVLFFDGTGDSVIFDTDALLADNTTLPETTTVESDAAHHGVSIELSDGTFVTTLSDRTGIVATDADGNEVARSTECPGVHGEGTVKDEVVIVGCENGALAYANGEITKLSSPDDFGRIGNMFTTEESAIALGDYKSDPDAEGYLLQAFSLVDTAAGTISVHELPEGVGYTFRDLGRGSDNEAIILGSDGSLHLFSEADGSLITSIPVIDAWEGPAEWQDAHPALKVQDGIAYVTDPATSSIHAVDLETEEITTSETLPGVPNEIALS
ncbi:zinc metallochaperone AztD [Pseudoclavibacter sp. JSM 162008]|uniref:zinc metallochaperone AztD n=1 Tax=Pseudoclavibacter sp. JSM 162008 TaxID=3229855 RepID=UPI003525BC2D